MTSNGRYDAYVTENDNGIESNEDTVLIMIVLIM